MKCIYLLISVLITLSASAKPGHKTGFVFRENVGQVVDQRGANRHDIAFLLSGQLVDLYINAGKLEYQWKEMTDSGVLRYHRMEVSLEGSRENAVPLADEEAGPLHRYYLPHCYGQQSRGYTRLTYRDIYPDIDWVLYIRNGRLKHDFVVRPGGDVRDIRIRYKGHQTLTLQEGSLLATTPLGELREQSPVAWEAASGREVPIVFQLDGNLLSYRLDTYAGELVIDPALEWASYLGGIGTENLKKITAGLNGEVYAVGDTYSPGLATTGAYQGTIGVGKDSYIAKFDSAGTCLWVTYYGGNNQDEGRSICTAPNGDIFICGATQSTNVIATQGSFQPNHGGGS